MTSAAPSQTAMIQRLAAFFAARRVEAYVVGGMVRDRLQGRESARDIDLAVKGDAAALARELAGELGGTLRP